MAIVHSNPNSGLSLVSYCARVAFAVAIIVIGSKIAVDHWPCDIAPIAACPL
jgi:hypothetical protein